jgi:hypothetical protein
MTLTTLNLPMEIPWERICVTGNMIARDGRDLPGVVESVNRTNDG